MGQGPQTLKPAKYKSKDEVGSATSVTASAAVFAKKDLVGVDVFLDWSAGTADELGEALSKLATQGTKLTMMSNRGVKVWPGGQPETFCSDHWRCRFLSTDGNGISHQQIVALLQSVGNGGLDFIKTENLYNFDGERGYSLDQGE
jgi:isocitrate dehydrogenase